MSFYLWKMCPSLTPDEVPAQSAMIKASKKITHRTFRKHVGWSLDTWAEAHGYITMDQRGGLHLVNDPYVAYYKSHWNGEPCFYLVWSAMEVIWREDHSNPR